MRGLESEQFLVGARQLSRAVRLSVVHLVREANAGTIPGIKIRNKWHFNIDQVKETLLKIGDSNVTVALSRRTQIDTGDEGKIVAKQEGQTTSCGQDE